MASKTKNILQVKDIETPGVREFGCTNEEPDATEHFDRPHTMIKQELATEKCFENLDSDYKRRKSQDTYENDDDFDSNTTSDNVICNVAKKNNKNESETHAEENLHHYNFEQNGANGQMTAAAQIDEMSSDSDEWFQNHFEVTEDQVEATNIKKTEPAKDRKVRTNINQKGDVNKQELGAERCFDNLYINEMSPASKNEAVKAVVHFEEHDTLRKQKLGEEKCYENMDRNEAFYHPKNKVADAEAPEHFGGTDTCRKQELATENYFENLDVNKVSCSSKDEVAETAEHVDKPDDLWKQELGTEKCFENLDVNKVPCSSKNETAEHVDRPNTLRKQELDTEKHLENGDRNKVSWEKDKMKKKIHHGSDDDGEKQETGLKCNKNLQTVEKVSDNNEEKGSFDKMEILNTEEVKVCQCSQNGVKFQKNKDDVGQSESNGNTPVTVASQISVNQHLQEGNYEKRESENLDRNIDLDSNNSSNNVICSVAKQDNGNENESDAEENLDHNNVEQNGDTATHITKILNDSYGWFQSYFKATEVEATNIKKTELAKERKVCTNMNKKGYANQENDSTFPEKPETFGEHISNEVMYTEVSGKLRMETKDPLSPRSEKPTAKKTVTMNVTNDTTDCNMEIEHNHTYSEKDRNKLEDEDIKNVEDSEPAERLDNEESSSMHQTQENTHSTTENNANKKDSHFDKSNESNMTGAGTEDEENHSIGVNVGKMWNDGYSWLKSNFETLGESTDHKKMSEDTTNNNEGNMTEMDTQNKTKQGEDDRGEVNSNSENPADSKLDVQTGYETGVSEGNGSTTFQETNEHLQNTEHGNEYKFSHDDFLTTVMYLGCKKDQLKQVFPTEINAFQTCARELSQKRATFEEYHKKTIAELKKHLEDIDENNHDNNKVKVVNSTVGAGAGTVVLASVFVPVLWPVTLSSFAVTAATAINGYLHEKDIEAWEDEARKKLMALQENFQNEISDVNTGVERMQQCIFEILSLWKEKIKQEFEPSFILCPSDGNQNLSEISFSEEACKQIETKHKGPLETDPKPDKVAEFRHDITNVHTESKTLECDPQISTSGERKRKDIGPDKLDAKQFDVDKKRDSGENETLLCEKPSDDQQEVHLLQQNTSVCENSNTSLKECNTEEMVCDDEDMEKEYSGENSALLPSIEKGDENKASNIGWLDNISNGVRNVSDAGQTAKQGYDNLKASIDATVGPLGPIALDSVSSIATTEASGVGIEAVKKLYGNASVLGGKSLSQLSGKVSNTVSSLGGKAYLGGSAVRATATRGHFASGVAKTGNIAAKSAATKGGIHASNIIGKQGGRVAAHAIAKNGGLVVAKTVGKKGGTLAAHAAGKKGSLLAAHTVGKHGGTLAAKTVGRLGHFTMFAGAGLAVFTIGIDVNTAVSAALQIAEGNKHDLHHAIEKIIEIMESEKSKMDELFYQCDQI